MGRKRNVALAGLGGLALLAAVAFYRTERQESAAVAVRGEIRATASPAVDESLLLTARRLRSLATTQEEDQLAVEAIRQADHVVDLGYTMALTAAHLQPGKLTPQTKALNDKIHVLEGQLKDEDSEIARLNKLMSTADRAQADELQDSLDLQQAQKNLNQEELEDAHQDLIEAGGDDESAIQRKFNEHVTLQHTTATSGAAAKAAQFAAAENLVGQGRQWWGLRQSGARLEEARRDAEESAGELGRKSLALNQRLREERKTLAPGAEGGAAQAGSKEQKMSALEATRAHTVRRTMLADYAKQGSGAQQLTKLYGQWRGIVERQTRETMHALARSMLWLLLTLLVLLVGEGALERYIERLGYERRPTATMKMVLRLCLRAVGAVVLLVVLFGPPTQLSTMVAFAGAGLTVALKDFIVAFFGWFVLMGRNGIHVGDWVEINGIGGEVVEIGLLKTVVMETGNWNDSGHPTGRQVSFVNSFAMEGHFFNFTTKGQWLWDELSVLVPAEKDPYALMAGIQALVETETKASAELAEQEWHRATTTYGVQAFSAAPAISIRPTQLGISLVVKYITQANERYAVRSRLYRQVVELMRGPGKLGA